MVFDITFDIHDMLLLLLMENNVSPLQVILNLYIEVIIFNLAHIS